jgi:hypothetical protein
LFFRAGLNLFLDLIFFGGFSQATEKMSLSSIHKPSPCMIDNGSSLLVKRIVPEVLDEVES